MQVGLFEQAVSELYNYSNLPVEAVHLGIALNFQGLLRTKAEFLNQLRRDPCPLSSMNEQTCCKVLDEVVELDGMIIALTNEIKD